MIKTKTKTEKSTDKRARDRCIADIRELIQCVRLVYLTRWTRHLLKLNTFIYTEIYQIAKGHSSDPFLVYTLPTSEPYGLECGGLEGQLLNINWQWPQKGIQKGTYNFHYEWAKGL